MPLKFCCEKFESYYNIKEITELTIDGNQISRIIFPYVRIVKVPENKWNKGYNLYRAIIVYGINKSNFVFFNISYCPFCGKSILKQYSNDLYVNDKSENYFDV